MGPVLLPEARPRFAIWRKLKRLGVAQLSDGLVALPADARTREQLEWIGDEAIEEGATASIWLARPATLAQERESATAMADARAAEYQAVIDQAAEAAGGVNAAAAVRKLPAELRRNGRRDVFPPPERDRADAAVRALAQQTGTPQEQNARLESVRPLQAVRWGRVRVLRSGPGCNGAEAWASGCPRCTTGLNGSGTCRAGPAMFWAPRRALTCGGAASRTDPGSGGFDLRLLRVRARWSTAACVPSSPGAHMREPH